MKRHFILIPALLALVACNDKEDFTPGDPDSPDCMGVYFDEDNGGDFIFVPGEEAKVTLKMHRKLTSEAADVPVYGIANAEGIIFPTSVHFDAGSADASIELDFAGIPIKQTVRFSVNLPEEYLLKYSDTRFNYESTALISQWEPANQDGSPVVFYFTEYDYNPYDTALDVIPAVYQPIECEAEVLPGAGLFIIHNFLHTGVDMTFTFVESPYSDYAGYYRVLPTYNYITMNEAYDSDSYGDSLYNAWYVYDSANDEYTSADFIDLDGNAAGLDYPMFYANSDSYAYEYSYAVMKSGSRPFSSVSMGFSGSPTTDVSLPTYFYLYFRWDGESGM